MNKAISHSEIKEILDYNPDTGLFHWKVKPSAQVKAGDQAGYLNRGYVKIKIGKIKYPAHRLAWLYYYGSHPESILDHINRIKSDNRISNLRETTNFRNAKNKWLYKSNTSGVNGVCWDKTNKKWTSTITSNGRVLSLGNYGTFDDAVIARLSGEQLEGWDGCIPLTPAKQYFETRIKPCLSM